MNTVAPSTVGTAAPADTGTPAAPTAANVREFYELYEPLFFSLFGTSFHHGYWPAPDDDTSYEQALDNATDQLIGRLPVGLGHRVLDVGCGVGVPAVRLACTTGAEVIGISINQTHVAHAKAFAETEGMAGTVRF